MLPPRSLVCCLLLGSLGLAAPGLAEPQLELLTDAVPEPMYVTNAGDERLFIAERAGRVWVFENGALLPTPFLDVSSFVATRGEGGLASLAFHPDHAQNGRVFVFFTERSDPGLRVVVARFTRSMADPNTVSQASRRDLLRVELASNFHAGGQLQFGPDGFLYVSVGDGGAASLGCNALDPQQLTGKLLRLDVDVDVDAAPWYAIPPTNPFAGDADPGELAADELWAVGFRNPFRFSFDRSSGDLWLGDVGESAREEIDFQPATSAGGESYGWKVMEGTLCQLPGFPVGGGCPPSTPPCGDPSYTAPLLELPHPADPTSVTGGVVYRGSESPAYQGRYVFGDAFQATLWALSRSGPPTLEPLFAPGVVSPVAIGEDRDGELYVVDLFASRVYRLHLGAEPASPDLGCVLRANRATAKLAHAAARDLQRCALDGARGRLAGSVADCLGSDRRGAVARRVARLEATAAAHCAAPQPLGFVGADAASGAATASERELLHAIFGADPDGALADAGSERDAHRCQRSVQRAVNACQQARRAAFLRCKKAGLRDGSIASTAALAACLDADAKGRIARVCDEKLARVIERSCRERGVDLAAAFPGCASDSADALGTCLEESTRCRHCRLLDAADGLGVSCDLEDDGAVNLSCVPLE